jgi:uncharacterized protein
MLIDIRTISRSTGASLAIETEIGLSELNFSFQDYRLTRPPFFTGVLQNVGNGIFTLTGHVSAGYEGECARCLQPVREELDLPLAETYRPLASADAAGDDEGYRYEGSQLDIGQAIRDNLLPAIPRDCFVGRPAGSVSGLRSQPERKRLQLCAFAARRQLSPFDQLKQLL